MKSRLLAILFPEEKNHEYRSGELLKLMNQKYNYDFNAENLSSLFIIHRMDAKKSLMYMDLKKLCKKGTIQINKQNNLFKLVHDHFDMLVDILQAVI